MLHQCNIVIWNYGGCSWETPLRAVQFLPRDAMHKRGLSRRAMSVRLSVRLSVTFVYSVETNKYIFSFFQKPVFMGNITTAHSNDSMRLSRTVEKS